MFASFRVGDLPQADTPAAPQARASEGIEPWPFQLLVGRGDAGARPASAGAVQGLAQDLAEPLAAILDYLQVSRRLADEPTPAHTAELAEAVARAIEQANRARDLVRRLRSVTTTPKAVLADLV